MYCCWRCCSCWLFVSYYPSFTKDRVLQGVVCVICSVLIGIPCSFLNALCSLSLPDDQELKDKVDSLMEAGKLFVVDQDALKVMNKSRRAKNDPRRTCTAVYIYTCTPCCWCVLTPLVEQYRSFSLAGGCNKTCTKHKSP